MDPPVHSDPVGLPRDTAVVRERLLEAGLVRSQAEDQELAGRVVTALWIRDGRVVAGLHPNDGDAIGPILERVGREATDALRDPAIALDEVPA